MKNCSLGIGLSWCFISAVGFAQSPSLNRLTPSAVAPSQMTTVTILGENLSGPAELWTSFPARATISSASADAGGDSSKLNCNISVPADVPRGIGAIRVATTNGISNLLLVLLDELPSLIENRSNTTARAAQPLPLSVAVDGAAEEFGFDYYQFDAAAGQHISVDVVAHRLGSTLDPVVRLLDATGRELAYCDDDPGAFADARLNHRFAAACRCTIELRDIRYQGGTRHWYRLRVGEIPVAGLPFLPVHEPDFRPTSSPVIPERAEVEPNDSTAEALPIPVPVVIAGKFGREKDRDFYEFEVAKGQRLVFAGRTRSLGYPCDLYLELRKGDDSLLKEANVTGADEGTITNTFTEAGTCRLLVEELNRQGGPGFGYRLEIEPLPPGFTLSVDADKFEAPAGGPFEMKVSCVRRSYDGPITLSLGGGASGFILTDNTIPAKTNVAQMKVTMPADFQPGRMVHFTVRGHAQVEDTRCEIQASTMPAIRKLFPQMLYPPLELDGLIALGVKAGRAPDSPAPTSSPERRSPKREPANERSGHQSGLTPR